ncbi:MAG TPA: hypothetical protein VM243_21015 [Phycisphaerae bacterium]|nr:hypothetical protein [Phycisphaerae bacterium]
MRWTLPLACLLVIGCGPMSKPMVSRLEEKDQALVDQAWSNMLTPVERLDRILLLDTILAHESHQIGIDRLHFVSGKDLPGGTVRMEVFFDRQSPEGDLFAVTYVDRSGRVLRSEKYTREEVDGRFEFLIQRPPNVEEIEGIDPAECEQLKAQAAEHEARMREIKAATQPAHQP